MKHFINWLSITLLLPLIFCTMRLSLAQSVEYDVQLSDKKTFKIQNGYSSSDIEPEAVKAFRAKNETGVAAHNVETSAQKVFNEFAPGKLKTALTSGEMNSPVCGGSPTMPEVTGLCEPDEIAEIIFEDSFENINSQIWGSQVILGEAAANHFTSCSGTPDIHCTDDPQTGTYSLLGKNKLFHGARSSVVSLQNPVSLLGKTRMTFSHKFNLPVPEFGELNDGGSLEYSVDDGLTWHDAGPLFIKGQGYAQCLNEQSVFAGNAAEYVKTQLDLSAFAGKNVKFRFKMHSEYPVFDSSINWSIDDVSIYRCKLADQQGDVDSDGVLNETDNCPYIENPDQVDTDADGFGDSCDNDIDNDGVLNQDDAFPNDSSETKDIDGDGIGDNRDNDDDNDNVFDDIDNCPRNANQDQADLDADGLGNVCDDDIDGDGYKNQDDGFPYDPGKWSDSDGDGIEDSIDNCQFNSNADQADQDADGFGDICDDDRDGDTYHDIYDIFPDDQTEWADQDEDGIGDNIDVDDDNDNVVDNVDNCYLIANFDQADTDQDGIGDVCDKDIDGDNVENRLDMFPRNGNEWNDNDLDGIGDNADIDDDNDFIVDVEDNCSHIANPEQLDENSDGTGDICKQYTVLVKDIKPNFFNQPDSSHPLNFRAGEKWLTFNVGSELWTTNGIEKRTQKIGSSALPHTNPRIEFKGDLYFKNDQWLAKYNYESTAIENIFKIKVSDLFEFNDFLLISSYDSSTKTYHLYKSDGTTQGTKLIRFLPGRVTQSMQVDNKLFMLVADKTETNPVTALWVTDGINTKELTKLGTYGSSSALTNVAGTLFFKVIKNSFEQQLWKSDGTVQGTSMLKSLALLNNFTAVNDELFFTNFDELWKTDGTQAGTVLVREINSSQRNHIHTPVVMNTVLFFSADDGVNGRELWKSDGTENGTQMVKNINPEGSAQLYKIASVNDTMFFFADDGVHGKELWKSDGTEQGTVIVKDMNPTGSSVSFSSHFFPVPTENVLYFAADNSIYGRELWKTDGTENGTILLGDINPGSANSITEHSQIVNEKLFFSATNSEIGEELWKVGRTPHISHVSVITENGKILIAENDVIQNAVSKIGLQMTHVHTNKDVNGDYVINNTEYYRLISAGKNNEFDADLTCNSPIQGDDLVIDIQSVKYFPAVNSGQVQLSLSDTLVPANYQLIVCGALADSNGESLDGNIDGVRGDDFLFSFTVLPGDITTDADADGIMDYQDNCNNIANADQFDLDNDGVGDACDNDIDGDGVINVDDFYPRNPKAWLDANNPAINSDDDPVPDNIDNCPTITNPGQQDSDNDGVGDVCSVYPVLIKDILPGINPYNFNTGNMGGEAAQSLFFFADDDVHGYELWVSDGTEIGTRLLKDINPGVNGSTISPEKEFYGHNNIIYFMANDGVHGRELWRTDGTETGTFMLKDINPGSADGAPSNFMSMGNNLYFSACHDQYDCELWKSDGTQSGTVMVKDLNEFSSSSSKPLAVIENTLYFRANDSTRNFGIWKTDGTSEGTLLASAQGLAKDNSAYIKVDKIIYFVGYKGNNKTLFKLDHVSGEVQEIATGVIDHSLVSMNGWVFYYVNADHGDEIWKTNGIDNILVRNTDEVGQPLSLASSNNSFVYKNKVYFGVQNINLNGGEVLWQSDGTTEGTKPIKSPLVLAKNTHAVSHGDMFYFYGSDGQNGFEVWSSNGTSEGTKMSLPMLSNVNQTDTIDTYPLAKGFRLVNNTIFFHYQDKVYGNELWKMGSTAFVSHISGFPQTEDGLLSESENTRHPISAFTMTFSHPMQHSLDESGSVLNLDNYLLVQAGENNLLDTQSCETGVEGDDTVVSISSATHTPMVGASQVHLTLSSVLKSGQYRLFVCGTLKDALGDHLDGDFDGRKWDDFQRNFTILGSDVDSDGIVDKIDTCVNTPNAKQLDFDDDGVGDVCDTDDDNDGVDDIADRFPLDPDEWKDSDNDGIGNSADADDDNDNILDGVDNCPYVRNNDQLDTDKDGQGNVCDSDDDNDGILDIADNCPMHSNPDQLDQNLDGNGDVCESVNNEICFPVETQNDSMTTICL